MKALSVIESILRNRYQFFAEIRDGVALPAKMRAMIVSSLVFTLVYGAVLGSSHSALQALSSAIKLPLLFLATLAICAPTLYFFQILFGSRQTITQTIALMLTAITVTAVLLLAFAPVTLFFLLSSGQYQVFKLINVVVFAIAGLRGVAFLGQGIKIVAGDEVGASARKNVVRAWVLLYAIVGSQTAWVLRPFVGAPSLPFELFRGLGSSFFSNVLASLGEILGFWAVR
jgi:hypothetical protein